MSHLAEPPASTEGLPASARPALSVENLTVVYDTPAGPVKAVDDVTFSLRPGERLGIIGESGSGKTTLATALLRLTRRPGRLVGGRIVLDGRDITALRDSELRAIRLREIALVPQGAMNSLSPVMRVREQLVDGLLAHGERGSVRQLDERVAAFLARVGLDASIARRYPHQLSGGQKQRVVMAIATSLEPKVIVADEPTSALDVVVQRQVMHTLGRLQAGLGAAVVLIGHDMGLIAQFADTVGVMYAGRLVELGPVADVIANPLHPYARLLIDSLPSLEAKKELVGIPGLPPALLELPPGCTFHPRCPFAFDRCSIEIPAFSPMSTVRAVACHLYPLHSSLPAGPGTAASRPNP
ncbi:MAG: ABC transporter ATP-binding protein [Solirubrobacterales bacterium]|nr:ABC transporter ATP-binding protein [Solirubrobacterales bacterium]